MQLEKQEEKFKGLKEDEHVLKLWEPLNFNVTKNYKFVPNGIVFKTISLMLYCIVLPILFVFNKLVYGCKVIGKENLKKTKGARITISNHVHPMDCTINAMIQAPRQVHFLSLQNNFKIPVVRHIIKLLHAIPIPSDIDAKVKFYEAINNLLKKGKIVHFYPEGSLWPYYDKIRNFKNGAFKIAVENDVPIVPIVYKFVKPTGIRKYLKKKPCMEIHIKEPIYPDKSIPKKDAVEKMKQTAVVLFNEK